ncbi:MAG: SurA N-terminal domain-containing protein [Pseudomonadota bacterium]|nr:SurA N-terminal domain-containing protein [Pseudomonadota bacterium]
MLLNIKKKVSGIAGTIVVLLLALIVCLGGLQYYSKFSSSNAAAASINGKDVPASSLSSLFERNKYFIKAYNPGAILTASDLSSMKSNILESLINIELKTQYINENNMLVPNFFRDAYVMAQPNFQVDGKFSPELYMEKVSQNFGSEKRYLDQLDSDLLMMQLKVGLTDSSFILPNELTSLTYLLNQARDIQYAEIDAAKLKAPKVSKIAIEKYYSEHKKDFVREEQARVSYVLLDKKSLHDNLKPKENELLTYLDNNKQSFQDPPKFKFSIYDIVIQDKHEISNSDKDLISSKILPLFKKDVTMASFLKNNKNLKVKVTTESSWEDSSKLPDSFKQDLHKFKSGFSDYVKIDNGFSIITITAVKYHDVKLSDVRTAVTAAWRNEKAEKEYASLSEKLSDLAYTTDGIAEIAKELNMKIKTTKFFTRSTNSNSGVITKNPNFIAASFSEDVYLNELNSSLVKINDNQVVVLHLLDKKPEKQESLDDSAVTIKEILNKKAQADAAKEVATLIESRLKLGKDVSSIFKNNDLSWRTIKNMKREGIMNRTGMEIREKVFLMPIPTNVGVSCIVSQLENSNYVVIKLDKIHIAQPLIAYPSTIHEKYLGYRKTWELSAFESYLKSQAKIKVNENIVNKI